MKLRGGVLGEKFQASVMEGILRRQGGRAIFNRNAEPVGTGPQERATRPGRRQTLPFS